MGNMRRLALIVLLAIAFSMVIPPAVSLTMSDSGKAIIGTLNVCGPATPALSSNGEMPCMNECRFHPLSLAGTEVLQISNSPLLSFFFASQDERPPKA